MGEIKIISPMPNSLCIKEFPAIMGEMRDFFENAKTKMNMEEKELKAKDIPWGYARCFNDACKRKDTCMHYLANVFTSPQERHIGQAVYPTSWQEG